MQDDRVVAELNFSVVMSCPKSVVRDPAVKVRIPANHPRESQQGGSLALRPGCPYIFSDVNGI
jgi:hypothetical protein